MRKRHILIISVTAVVLLALLAGCGRQEESARTEEPAGQEKPVGMDESMPMEEPAGESGVMLAQIVDPVCGMKIDEQTAITVDREGQTFHFCSAQCRDRFLEDPEKYISEKQMKKKGVAGGGDPMEVDRHRMGEDEDRSMTAEEGHEGHDH